MIIVLKPGASKAQADALLAKIEDAGLQALCMPGTERTVLGALGDERVLGRLHLESDPAVESVKPILAPYKLVGREMHPHDTIVEFGDVAAGGEVFLVVAGVAVMESRQQLEATAQGAKQAGARAWCGGGFTRRLNPYDARGLGDEGLALMKRIGDEAGLATIAEVCEAQDVDSAAPHADAFQVGGRNMGNVRLLAALGGAGKPVLLKRDPGATLEELLLAAEHVVRDGNRDVILCEAGIRGFESATRGVLDLTAVPFLKQRSHLPVLVDPSQGTGRRDLVAPMAFAAAACGADGVLLEVHPDPAQAMADGEQTLFLAQLPGILHKLRGLLEAGGKRL